MAMGPLDSNPQIAHFGDCILCGTPIYGATARYDFCRQKGGTEKFHCVNGHAQVYRKSDVTRLKEELEQEEQRRKAAEASERTARHAEAVAKGKQRAQAKRLAQGTCPCCKRSFQNLRRHMKAEHPRFVSEAKSTSGATE